MSTFYDDFDDDGDDFDRHVRRGLDSWRNLHPGYLDDHDGRDEHDEDLARLAREVDDAVAGAEPTVEVGAAPPSDAPVACPRCDWVGDATEKDYFEGSLRGPLRVLKDGRVVHEHGALTDDD